MINGLTRSSAFEIKKSQQNHLNKLKHIITSTSTMLGFSTDYSQSNNESIINISLQNYSFKFYDSSYSNLYVSSNGFIKFGVCVFLKNFLKIKIFFLSLFI